MPDTRQAMRMLHNPISLNVLPVINDFHCEACLLKPTGKATKCCVRCGIAMCVSCFNWHELYVDRTLDCKSFRGTLII